jgi:molybdopterin-biosynthesis enzyme MoeA-like protein
LPRSVPDANRGVITNSPSTGAEMNEARLRLTHIPTGADLILNKVSGAPGFWIGNVIVMAGVPSIMQAMLDEVAPKLKIGVRMLSEMVRADAREGDIGMQLGEIAKANPGVAIGSYPFFDPQHGPNTNVVLRARDAQKLALAKSAVEDMLERVRRAQSQNCRSVRTTGPEGEWTPIAHHGILSAILAEEMWVAWQNFVASCRRWATRLSSESTIWRRAA